MKFVGKLFMQILLLAVIVAAIMEFQDPLQQNWQEIKDSTTGITLFTEAPKHLT